MFKLAEELLSILLLVIDLLGGPEIIMILFVWIKSSVRKLNKSEYAIVKNTMGTSIKKKLILINDEANVLTSNGRYAFVSFFLIHTNNSMHDRTFAHELIHIWQYTRFGSPYIIKALFAQRSKEGYDYSGATHLMNTYSHNKGIMEYNFEQQGEILADYYMLTLKENEFSIPIYQHNYKIYKHFIDDIQSMRIYRF